MDHIAIIGAGQAGYSVAINLRENGFEGRVSLYGSEDVPPYERPPLSKKFLMGDSEARDLAFRDEDFYREQQIDLHLGAEVTEIETDQNRFKYQGEWITYTHLVIVTGAIPRYLPADLGGTLDGLYYLRNLKDAAHIKSRLSEWKRLVVIGGGFIGLEFAAVAAEAGISVTVLEMSSRILERAVGPASSDAIRQLHQDKGVEILEGVGLKSLEGEGSVSKAVLSDGREISIDAAIVGIGASPVVGLAEAAGLSIANGIRVNEFGQTSVENIWAAGDCTSFPLSGDFMRLESVQNAVDQGAIVARNILGQKAIYDPVPWFWTEQYDSRLQIVGLQGDYDQVVERPGLKEGSTSYWYFKQERLNAVEVLNDPKTYMLAKKLREANVVLDKIKLADNSVNLKTLLKGS